MTDSSPHLEKMRESIDFIKSIKVINTATGEDHTRQLKCLKGWCITLKAIIDMWHYLKAQFQISFLITRQLNQDPLKKFFGAIRQQGGNADNPTPIQFKRAYHKLFHTNLLNISSTNCEVDGNEPLAQLSDIQALPETSFTEARPLNIISMDYKGVLSENRIFKNNAMAYVSGYLLRKTYEHHKCSKCSTLADESKADDKYVFMMFKSYDSDSSNYSGLVVPSEEMITYANELEDSFLNYLSQINCTVGVGKKLIEIMENIPLNAACEKFNKTFLIKLFIRMRMYYCLKYVNRELVATKRKNRKFIKLVHL